MLSPDAQAERFRIEVRPGAGRSTLADDVRAGLSARPYRLPPKHFYDAAGSALFERICDTPEYYLTRAEGALLARVAPDVVARADAAELVELGSGSARKTRLLLDAIARAHPSPTYVPIDISEAAQRDAAGALLASYPALRVHAVVDDFAAPFPPARAPGSRRLVAFLGSTIGNLDPAEAAAFVASIARRMAPGDHLLLGVDLVKDPRVIERAYNDAAGVTAAFNRNVLAVINRELGGTFEPAAFDHVAFYDGAKAQVEMHLRARRDCTVRIAALGLDVPLARGETIHTEISRKFTREGATALLDGAGLRPVAWWQGDDAAFGLALAEAPRRHQTTAR